MATPIISDYHQRFGDVVNFVYIYIREAHANDEWPLGDVESHRQPQSQEERNKLAQKFQDKYVIKSEGVVSDIPVLIDSMENHFQEAYAVWPERFFIIDSCGKLAHISEPCTELGFDRYCIEEWLQRYVREEIPSNEGETKGKEESQTIDENHEKT